MTWSNDVHKIIRLHDLLSEVKFTVLLRRLIFSLLFVRGVIFLIFVRATVTNGEMYTRLQLYRGIQHVMPSLHRQFVHCLHSNSQNFKYRAIARSFHKNAVLYKHNDDSGNRKDNVLNMTNSQYLDHMYNAWLKDRKSVDSSWDSYFKTIHAESPKDSYTRLGTACISLSSNLITSNLAKIQTNSEFALISPISHYHFRMIRITQHDRH